MKNRYILYGYQIRNGQFIEHPKEAEIVSETFFRRADRETLQAIADDFTARKIEYLPEKFLWDKARVKRMLDNRAYLGEKEYPAIISGELFDSAHQSEDPGRLKQTWIDKDTKLIKSAAVCAECGRAITRRTDSRLQPPTTWKCTNCKFYIRTSDGDLKTSIRSILNRLINDPSLAEIEENDTHISSLELRRTQQELYRMMNSSEFTERDSINMVLRCAAKTYESITSARHITDRMTAVLRKAKPLSSFNEKLFEKTVENILIDRSGAISLKLQNGKVISNKEGDNDDRTAASSQSDGDPCHSTAGTDSTSGQEATSSSLLSGILQKR